MILTKRLIALSLDNRKVLLGASLCGTRASPREFAKHTSDVISSKSDVTLTALRIEITLRELQLLKGKTRREEERTRDRHGKTEKSAAVEESADASNG